MSGKDKKNEDKKSTPAKCGAISTVMIKGTLVPVMCTRDRGHGGSHGGQ